MRHDLPALNANDIITEVTKMLGEEITPIYISTSHRLSAALRKAIEVILGNKEKTVALNGLKMVAFLRERQKVMMLWP